MSALGEQQLFQQPAHEAPQPRGDVLRRGRAFRELAASVLPFDDRPCDQAREKGQIEQQTAEALFREARVAEAVDQVGQRVEGEEGDAERQRQGKGRGKEREEKAEIFIDAQQREIARDAEREPELFPARDVEREQAEEIAPQRAAEQDGQLRQSSEGVKQQAQQAEQEILRPAAGQQPVKDQRNGQKDEQERRAVEGHAFYPPFSETIAFIIREGGWDCKKNRRGRGACGGGCGDRDAGQDSAVLAVVFFFRRMFFGSARPGTKRSQPVKVSRRIEPTKRKLR